MENAESKNSRVAKTNKVKLMLLSKFVLYDSKKSRFIKKTEASGFSSNLGIRTPLIKIWHFYFRDIKRMK